MGKKFVLVDDLTGDQLPEDTEPVNLSLGRTTYTLYLSEDSHGKLLEALEPFISDADTAEVAPSRSTGAPRASKSAAATSDDGWTKDEKAAARHWAIETGFEFESATEKDADGNPVKKKLGDRGRIPHVVMTAWTAAGSPGIGE